MSAFDATYFLFTLIKIFTVAKPFVYLVQLASLSYKAAIAIQVCKYRVILTSLVANSNVKLIILMLDT